MSQGINDFLISCPALVSLCVDGTVIDWLDPIVMQRLRHLYLIGTSKFDAHSPHFCRLSTLSMSAILNELQLTELLRLHPLQSISFHGKMSLLRCFYDNPHIREISLDTRDQVSLHDILQLCLNRPQLNSLSVSAVDLTYSWNKKDWSMFVFSRLSSEEEDCDGIPQLAQGLDWSSDNATEILKLLPSYEVTLKSLLQYQLAQLPNLTSLFHLSGTNISSLICKYCNNLQSIFLIKHTISYSELIAIVQACRKLSNLNVCILLDSDMISTVSTHIAHIARVTIKSTSHSFSFRYGIKEPDPG